MAKVIDFHTHAFPQKIAAKAVEQLHDYYQLEIANSGELQSLLQCAQAAGVDKVVLHAAATHFRQVQATNDWIAEAISDYVIGFGSLHPEYQDFQAELARMETLGLTGIKFHPEFQGFAIDDPRMWPIYEAIEDRFLVMFHMGDEKSVASAPHKLAKVLDAFPKLPVIAAHLGGYASWDEARHYILGREIYVDTSSALWVLSPEEATEIIRLHGVDRVLFGSDYPICTPQEELQRFNQLPLTKSEQEKILWKNGAELLQKFSRKRQKN